MFDKNIKVMNGNMHKSYEPMVYIVYLILEGLKQIFTIRVFQKKPEGLLDSNFCFYISINCFYIHINIGVRKGGFQGSNHPSKNGVQAYIHA